MNLVDSISFIYEHQGFVEKVVCFSFAWLQSFSEAQTGQNFEACQPFQTTKIRMTD